MGVTLNNLTTDKPVALGFQIELDFGKVGFRGKGKTGVPREKPLGARMTTNNKRNPHMTPRLGIEPGPHWGKPGWEVSALITVPSLLALSSILVNTTTQCPSLTEYKVTLLYFKVKFIRN